MHRNATNKNSYYYYDYYDYSYYYYYYYYYYHHGGLDWYFPKFKVWMEVHRGHSILRHQESWISPLKALGQVDQCFPSPNWSNGWTSPECHVAVIGIYYRWWRREIRPAPVWNTQNVYIMELNQCFTREKSSVRHNQVPRKGVNFCTFAYWPGLGTMVFSPSI